MLGLLELVIGIDLLSVKLQGRENEISASFTVTPANTSVTVCGKCLVEAKKKKH